MNITDIIPFDLIIGQYYKTPTGHKVQLLDIMDKFVEIDTLELDLGKKTVHRAHLVASWLPSDDIPWPDYPKWAKWVSMDEGGSWYAHIDKPVMIDFGYLQVWAKDGRGEICPYTACIPPAFAPTITGDWKTMIFERPENL